MSLGIRVGLALLVPILILVALAAYQITVIDRLVRQNREIGTVHRRLETTATEVREDLQRLGEFSRKTEATGDPAYREAVRTARLDVDDGIAGLLVLSLGRSERGAAIRAADLWRDALRDGGSVEPGDVQRLDDALGGLVAVSRQASAQLVERGTRQADRIRRASITLAVSCVVMAVFVSVLLARMVSQPVRRVARATRAVAEGDFSRRAQPSGPAEIAALARDFNSMAERLGEIDRLKENLLTNVSHDLKAPLASMHETNALILDGIPGPLTERQRTLLNHNQESNRRLSKMVIDLLDLTRLQGKAVAYEFESLDLVRVARAAIRDLQPAAAARNVAVVLNAGDGPAWTNGDETFLFRVVQNLVSNALRYSPRGERVEVDVGPAGEGTVRLVVRDRGPGVPDEHKNRIFERFYRVTRAAGAAEQGTGVGLAIAASIVSDHGGDIRVEDEPDGGSRFVVELPLTTGTAVRDSEAVSA